jgi:outer membrane protein TolC
MAVTLNAWLSMDLRPYISFLFRITLLILFFFSSALASSAQNTDKDKLSLEDCIQFVLQGSHDLHMTQATTDEKQALVYSAEKDRYPAFLGTLSSTHQTEPVPDYFPDNMFSYGIALEQPIYKGKAIVTGIEQAETSKKIAELDSIRTINDLVFTVYKLYFALLRAEKLEDEERQAVLRLEAHLKDSRSLFSVGIVPKVALLQSEVELAQGEQDLVDAKNRTENARSSLNIAMLHNIAAPLAIKDITPNPDDTFNWPDIQEQTINNRPEISQARLAVEFAQQDITLKIAPYSPEVNLRASYDSDIDYESSNDLDDSRWSRDNAMIRVTASWRLWTWDKNTDEKVAAQMALRRAKYNLAKITDEVTLEARIAFLHIEQGAKRVIVSKKAIEQAQENYRINQERYKQQIATSTDVLDAQELLTQAMTNFYDSLYGYELAKAAVWRAQGRFGEQYAN